MIEVVLFIVAINPLLSMGRALDDGFNVEWDFTARDGVADFQSWHERLIHVCTRYVTLTVYWKLFDGMKLLGQDESDCGTCHLEKQVQKPYKNTLDRNIVISNQLVYADLLVPGIYCGTQIGAILFIMDAFSKLATIYMLQNKSAGAVTAALK